MPKPKPKPTELPVTSACARAVESRCVPGCSRPGASRAECFHCGVRACAATREDWPPELRASVVAGLRSNKRAHLLTVPEIHDAIEAIVDRHAGGDSKARAQGAQRR